MKNLQKFLSLPLLIALGVLAAAQAEHRNAFTGTWKMNLPKSSFNPGPPFRSFTLTFTPDGVPHLDLVDAGGQSLNVSLPWSNGHQVTPAAKGMETTRVISKIRGNTIGDTWTHADKILEKVHGTISNDGKTLTMNVEGPGAQGTFPNRVVFDKQ